MVMFTFHLFGQVNSKQVSYEVGLNTIRLVNQVCSKQSGFQFYETRSKGTEIGQENLMQIPVVSFNRGNYSKL